MSVASAIEKKPLESVVTLQRGFDLPHASRKEGSVPVVASTGVAGRHNEAKVSGPGVVIGRSGSIGGGQYVKEDFWPLNTTLWAKDFKGNHPRFVYYLLKNIDFSGFNAGAGVPTLNRNHIASISVRCPEVDEQERIVEIISAYDDLIENNQRRIALLEDATRQLYKEWFVRFRFPGHEHVKIVDGVPEGWNKGCVSDLGKVVTGKTPSTKIKENFGGDIPFIKTPDMHASSIVIEPEERLSERGANTQANKYLPKYSVLVACIGARLGVVSLNALRCQTNQQINAVIPKEEFFTSYAYMTLKSFRERLLAIGGGATMPNVNKSKFSAMEIIFPPEKLLEHFHDLVGDSFSQMEKLIEINSRLSQARDLLLPKLMSGEIAA